jgi:hypothetical protein
MAEAQVKGPFLGKMNDVEQFVKNLFLILGGIISWQ